MLRNLRPSHHTLPISCLTRSTRAITFLLPHPQLRAYVASNAEPCITTPEPINQPSSSNKVFKDLTTWSHCLASSHEIPVLLETQPPQALTVDSILLQHALASNTLTQSRTPPTLDLTSHPQEASLTFLSWLYQRHLSKSISTNSLTSAWILGACIRSPKFQNDVLRRLAVLLRKREEEELSSEDGHRCGLIEWARRAYDEGSMRSRSGKIMPRVPEQGLGKMASTHSASSGIERNELEGTGVQEDICRPLRGFAVDVAAKRICDAGYEGQLLTLKERKALAGNEAFAEEVFAALGGHMGAGEVEITEFVREYLVKG